ncbi:MAG: MFS transporter [Firmicutes bacterium]|nr:MFS transporter [Bacillota bacterium]
MRRWWILASIAFGTFISVVNNSIVNVALPTISRVMGLDLKVLQWVILVFLLTVSATLLVAGRLADLVGRKRIYTGGFLVLISGSLICGLAPGFFILLVGRVIQAFGAAMPMANGMAITAATFPPEERGRALGIVGSVVAIGALLGPVLGGFLVDILGWRWVFLINLPLGTLAFFTALGLLPQDRPARRGEGFDYPGALLFAGAIIMLLLGLSGAGTPPVRWGLFLAGVIVAATFIWWERRQPHPLLDLELFRLPLFSTSLAAAFLSFLSMSGMMLLTPFYLEEVLGYPPYQVGLLMSPYPLMMAAVAPVSGWLSDRWGPVGLTTGGLFLNILALLSLSFMGERASYLEIALRLVVLGVGMGMFQSPNNSTVMGSVPFQKLGVAGGMNALVRNIGMTVGTAVVVMLFSTIRQLYLKGVGHPAPGEQVAAFLEGWQAVFLFSAGMAALAAVFSVVRARLLPKLPGDQEVFE